MIRSTRLHAEVLGLGTWTPLWPDWPTLRQVLQGQGFNGEPQNRPSTALLPKNEQRRAPLAVLMAVSAAEQAVRASGLAASTLPSIFASAHGDLDTVDDLCRTLAENPQMLSPTRFHHSVHNAPSGYWTQAVGAHGPTTAVAALEHTFAEGLREAVLQSIQTGPVLFVAVDTEAPVALHGLNPSRSSLAVALVLNARSGATLSGADPATVASVGFGAPAVLPEVLDRFPGNPLSSALNLLQAIARSWPQVEFPFPAHGSVLLNCASVVGPVDNRELQYEKGASCP